jgi:molybdopterin-guanine dinucleotide biosynthesis protein A
MTRGGSLGAVKLPYPDITGALIAGGRASRLGGAAKGLLSLDGQPLLGRSLDLFGRLFGASLLVVNDPAPYRRFEVAMVADLLLDRGAPGGLHAALSAATTPWVFAAGCDMPFLSPAGIALLADRRDGALAVVPRWDGRYEPLHALWSRDALPVLSRALADGDLSLQRLVELCGAAVVEAADWAAVDPAGRAFLNANTAEEAGRLGLSS